MAEHKHAVLVNFGIVQHVNSCEETKTIQGFSQGKMMRNI
jgi:hypothetical protein